LSDATASQAESGPRWHVVVGTLGLVYALGGILMHLFFLASVFFWKAMMSMAGLGDIEMPRVLVLSGLFQSAILLVLGVVLGIGSALVLARRPRGAALLRFWAGARLVMVLLSLVVGVVLTRPQVDFQLEMAERQRDLILERGGDPALVPVPERAQLERQVRWTTGGMALVVAAFPLFVGVLLTSRRKREEIEAWRLIDR
jgi:hypothetical protein